MCGLRAENIQKRLLSEAELTLEKAITIAVAMETAASDASELQGQRGEIAVHKIYTTKGTSSPILRRSKDDIDELCDMKI